MKKFIFLFGLLLAPLAHAEMPTQIGSIKLGADIKQYEQNIRSQTRLPIRFREYLEEVEVHSLPGFKSGYIAYGTCAKPGRIVRIKLKYADSSKSYFERLFKEYKSQLGRPSEWLGDPFHVITEWKWTFSDEQNQVNLYLRHNSSDTTEKLGTSMKITMNSLIHAEQQCFNAKFPDYRKKRKPPSRQDPDDWKGLIPE